MHYTIESNDTRNQAKRPPLLNLKKQSIDLSAKPYQTKEETQVSQAKVSVFQGARGSGAPPPEAQTKAELKKKKLQVGQVMNNKDRILQERAKEKELIKFQTAYDAKLRECYDQQASIEPLLIKLWDLAGQPDPHMTIDSAHGPTHMALIPMTTIPQEQFMRYLGTLQIVLFQIRPNFYPASYLKEIEMLKER